MSTFASSDFPGYLLDMNEFEEVEPIELVTRTMHVIYKHIASNKLFHVRFPPIQDSPDIVQAQRLFLGEIWILIRLAHPCIQAFRGFTLARDNVIAPDALFFNFHGKLTLQDLIDQEIEGTAPPEWNGTKKSIVLFGLTSALARLHSMRIIHRNLKPMKILLNDNYEPVLTDFSNATVLPVGEKAYDYHFGTAMWRSPEMALEKPYDLFSDVFTYGQIVRTMVTLKAPLDSYQNVREFFENYSDEEQLENQFPDELKESALEAIFQTSCVLNPEERCEISQYYDFLKNPDDNPSVLFPGTDIKEYKKYVEKITSLESNV